MILMHSRDDLLTCTDTPSAMSAQDNQSIKSFHTTHTWNEKPIITAHQKYNTFHFFNQTESLPINVPKY